MNRMAGTAKHGSSTGQLGLSTGPRRLRRDLEVVARTTSGSSGLLSGQETRQIRLIHHPISGGTVSLDQPDFANLNSGVSDSDPLIIEARGQALFSGSAIGLKSRANTRWWHNPLYIRLPGFPADRIARRLAHSSDWVFGRPAVIFWSICFFVTGLALCGKTGQLWNSVAGLATFQARHWLVALSVLAITKIVHELAHATVCRRMGAPCRQIGALFLCGTPCLYCDVSESWRIASPRRRAAVMLAGIYVEWILATIAAWVWLTSEPSFAHMLALHIMMVCGVSTFIFNINPLMKYDGYFVLSDMLNVGNLKSKASRSWHAFVLSFPHRFLQADAGTRRDTNLFFAAYHFLSGVYRYIVLVALSSWLYLLSTRCGLEPLGRGLMLLIAILTIWSLVGRWFNMWRGTGMWQQASILRRTVIGVTLLLGTGLVLVTPFDRRITAQGNVELADAVPLYVPEEGLIEEVFADFGSVVRQGDPLVQLHSSELELEHPNLAAQVRKLEDKLRSFRSRAAIEPELLEQVRTTEAMLAAAIQRLERANARIENLYIVAPRDGQVLRPEMQTPSPAGLERLADRRGGNAAADSVWCIVGNPHAKHVVLGVDASQRAQIEVGSPLKIRINTLSLNVTGGVLEATVDDISLVTKDANADPTASPIASKSPANCTQTQRPAFPMVRRSPGCFAAPASDPTR